MKKQITTRAFSGGILSPDLYGRKDIAKYGQGLAECRNFLPLLHGPLEKRNGTQYVGGFPATDAKYSEVVLIPFAISPELSGVLHFFPAHYATGARTAGKVPFAWVSENGAYLKDAELNITGQGIPPVAGGNVALIITTPDAVSSGLFWLSGLTGALAVLNDAWWYLEHVENAAVNLVYLRVKTEYNRTEQTLSAGAVAGKAAPRLALQIDPSDGVDRGFSATNELNETTYPFGWAQSFDRLTLVNHHTMPLEITRVNGVYSVSKAVLEPTSTAVSAGTSIAGTAVGTLLDYRNRYAVTALDAGGKESLPFRLKGSLPRRVQGLTGTNSADGELTVKVSWTAGDGRCYFLPDDRINLSGLAAPLDIYNNAEGEFYLVKSVTEPGAPAFNNAAVVLVREHGKALDTTVAFNNPVVSTLVADAIIGATALDGTELDLTAAGAYTREAWTKVSGASRYKVYKARAGVFGFIGETNSPFFRDDNITPDTSLSPPVDRSDEALSYPFHYDDTISTANYPVSVAYWEQRRVFAGGDKRPQTVWMSKTADADDFTSRSPLVPDDAIDLTVAAMRRGDIRAIAPTPNLLVLTDDGEWVLGTGNGVPAEPGNISARPQGYNGVSSQARPVLTGDEVLYVASPSNHVFAMAYTQSSDAYLAEDVSVLAPHLFRDNPIVCTAFTRWATPTLWLARADGTLLSCSYSRNQMVVAWAEHDVGGEVISLAVVSENRADVLYLAVRREHAVATTIITVERMAEATITALEDADKTDSFLRYSGAPEDTFTGLEHLEGETVSVLADGFCSTATVTDGTVVLGATASEVCIGLPFTARGKSLPIPVEGGRPKNISEVSLRIQSTNALQVGAVDGQLEEVPLRTTENYDAPTNLREGEFAVPVLGHWDSEGQVIFESTLPVPCRVLSLTAEVDFA